MNVIAVDPAASAVWFLHRPASPPDYGNGGYDAEADLPLDTAAPTDWELTNYDRDHDPFLGVGLAKDSGASGMWDLDKVQTFVAAPFSSGAAYTGTATLNYWSMLKPGSSGRGEVTAWLFSCTALPADSTNCTAIAAVGQDHQDGWPEAWAERSITFSLSGVVINPGERLGVKLMVEGGAADEMEFAFDTPFYASRLELP